MLNLREDAPEFAQDGFMHTGCFIVTITLIEPHAAFQHLDTLADDFNGFFVLGHLTHLLR